MLEAGVVAVIAAWALYGSVYAAWAERRWAPQGRFLTLPAGRVHLVEAGDGGPLVLCLHGASANAREWSDLAPLLQDGFRVVAMDRPGHGHSPAVARQDTLQAQAAAAARVIESLGSGPAIIVAHSLGCATALRLALDRPDLVAGLVLAAPASHPYPGKNGWHTALAANPLLGPLFTRFIIPVFAPIAAKGAVENTFAPASAPPGYAEKAGVGLLFRGKTFRGNAREVAAAKREFEAQYWRYDEIAAPTVIVSTDHDRVVSPRIHARALKRTLPNATLTVAAGAGHMPHRVAPHILAEAVQAIAARS